MNVVRNGYTKTNTIFIQPTKAITMYYIYFQPTKPITINF